MASLAGQAPPFGVHAPLNKCLSFASHRSTSVFLLPLTAQSLDTETDDAFTISHFVIFLREVLSLYWDSLLFRGGSDFSLRIDRKPVAFIGAGRLVAAVRV